jgi:hypothetical protein
VPPRYQLRTEIPPTLEAQPIRFDRPSLSPT